MKGAIKNYTSTVSARASISHIEEALVSVGATSIAKSYDTKGAVSQFNFTVVVNGNPLSFRLPANVEAVHRILSKPKSPRSRSKADNSMAQAERTAWKNLSDWIDAQVAMIQIEQAKFIQVFLPYAVNAESGNTFFEELESGKFKMLGK